MNLTHFNQKGAAHMVDVSSKPVTHRFAVARGQVLMMPETVQLIKSGDAAKGDVFGVARLAGIMAAKKTADLIPLCHPLPLQSVTIDLTMGDDAASVIIVATVRMQGQTGVEMEALTALSVTALTLYDMLKATDRAMTLGPFELIEKGGGRSGHFIKSITEEHTNA